MREGGERPQGRAGAFATGGDVAPGSCNGEKGTHCLLALLAVTVSFRAPNQLQAGKRDQTAAPDTDDSA